MNSNCPFCHLDQEQIWLSTKHACAFADSYPVSQGHTLVVPLKHVDSIYDLPKAEQAQLWALVAKVRSALQEKYRPDGFNVGINDGVAAGQTIAHAHIHVIPRRKGDVADPRGGVRWTIPDKAPYWDRP
jgi:diadenosine tetraphosphate (Ap4A) HIT family hydrolase